VEKQHKLVIEILRCLSKIGILDQTLIIGSWAAAFYKDFFKNAEYLAVIKTRDIDFLVPNRVRFSHDVDLEALLADLGFEISFHRDGSMKLESDELILEFLIPEIGPPKTKAYPLPQLKFSAQPLRHLAMLWRQPITIELAGIPLKLPHPADYCLHKLIIFEQRKTKEKKEKDQTSALMVLDALVEQKIETTLQEAFRNLTKKEKQSVMNALKKLGRENINLKYEK